MRSSFDHDSDLVQIYEGAKELFLRGERDRALERLKSIYEIDCTFRDVAEIVNDYYDSSPDEWAAKYQARFQPEHGNT